MTFLEILETLNEPIYVAGLMQGFMLADIAPLMAARVREALGRQREQPPEDWCYGIVRDIQMALREGAE